MKVNFDWLPVTSSDHYTGISLARWKRRLCTILRPTLQTSCHFVKNQCLKYFLSYLQHIHSLAICIWQLFLKHESENDFFPDIIIFQDARIVYSQNCRLTTGLSFYFRFWMSKKTKIGTLQNKMAGKALFRAITSQCALIHGTPSFVDGLPQKNGYWKLIPLQNTIFSLTAPSWSVWQKHVARGFLFL